MPKCQGRLARNKAYGDIMQRHHPKWQTKEVRLMSKKHGKRAGNKRRRVPKSGAVWRQSAEEATARSQAVLQRLRVRTWRARRHEVQSRQGKAHVETRSSKRSLSGLLSLWQEHVVGKNAPLDGSRQSSRAILPSCEKKELIESRKIAPPTQRERRRFPCGRSPR